MVNTELQQYIDAQTARGVRTADIEKALLQAGWEPAMVTEAMHPAATPDTMSEPADATPATAAVTTTPDATISVAPMTTEPQEAVTTAPALEDMFADVHPLSQTQPTIQPGSVGVSPVMGTPQSGLPLTNIPTMTPSTSINTEPDGIAQPFFAGTVKTRIADGLSGRGRVIAITSVIVVMLAVLVGGAYAYNSYANASARAYTNVIGNIVNLKSASFNFVVAPQFTDDSTVKNPLTNKELTSATVQLTGALQGLTTATPSAAAVIGIKADGAAGSDSYQADIRAINNITYVKFGDIPGVAESLKGSLKEQWFSLTTQSLSSINPETAGLDGRAAKQFSQSEITQLKNALQQSNAISLGGKDGGENIQGTDTTKYTMTLKAEGVAAFIGNSKSVLTARGMTEKQVAELQATVTQLGDVQGAVWIGKKDFQLYQIQFVFPAAQNSGLKYIGVTLTMWDHNRDLKVEIPTPVKPLDNILLEAAQGTSATPVSDGTVTTTPTSGVPIGGINANTSVNTNTAAVNTNTAPALNTNAATSSIGSADPDSDGLTNDQEEIYGTDPAKKDSDGDTYPDGEEVSNGYNPLGTGKLAQ